MFRNGGANVHVRPNERQSTQRGIPSQESNKLNSQKNSSLNREPVPSAPNTFSGGIFSTLKTCPKYMKSEGSWSTRVFYFEASFVSSPILDIQSYFLRSSVLGMFFGEKTTYPKDRLKDPPKNGAQIPKGTFVEGPYEPICRHLCHVLLNYCSWPR